MTNVLIFGTDPFRVDIIAHWLSGHEPGNFGLFHIARERGLCDTINPMSIPVYHWENGIPVLTPLEDFERTPLVSPYLCQDYDGHDEPKYHLVDEPCYYEEDPGYMNIRLETGWNLISAPISLLDSAVNSALQSINGCYSSVWTYDAINRRWKKYIVDGPELFNDLETIDPEKGYCIQMLEPAILTLYGDAETNGTMALKQGWNLVGYSCLTARSTEEALASIVGRYTSVWTYDASDGEWKKYVVGDSESSNNLRKMELGKGYWIEGTDECLWSVIN